MTAIGLSYGIVTVSEVGKITQKSVGMICDGVS
jgi:hypothetical protein